jgi:hypothetical protein
VKESCANCAHWTTDRKFEEPIEGHKVCARISEAKWDSGLGALLAVDDPYVGAQFETRPDFGCALFEIRAVTA